MSLILWWRRPLGGLVIDGVSWFLAFVLVVVLVAVILTIKAVLLTPVAVENKQRLDRLSQEPAREYERDLKRGSQ